MPELPEVETIRRSLEPLLKGRVVRAVRFLSPLAAGGRGEELSGRMEGARVEGLERHGKHLLVRLDRGTVAIHLRMTGKLLWNAAPGRHARCVVEFDEGVLVFDDIRQFGRMRWGAPEGLGPDALGLGLEEFARRLKGRRGRVKPLLLDQAVVAGLGNIYVDEALYRAGVHPLAAAGRLGRARLGRLHGAVEEVLREALEAGGSSISDYVDGRGERGSFQERHRVYGRAGEGCPRCGGTIRRMVVAQRGTHYCPGCQRR